MRPIVVNNALVLLVSWISSLGTLTFRWRLISNFARVDLASLLAVISHVCVCVWPNLQSLGSQISGGGAVNEGGESVFGARDPLVGAGAD